MVVVIKVNCFKVKGEIESARLEIDRVNEIRKGNEEEIQIDGSKEVER